MHVDRICRKCDTYVHVCKCEKPNPFGEKSVKAGFMIKNLADNTLGTAVYEEDYAQYLSVKVEKYNQAIVKVRVEEV